MKVTGKPTRKAVIATVVAGSVVILSVQFQQRTRTIEGTWIDLFEGSSFFEKEGVEFACSPEFEDAAHLSYYPIENSIEGRLVKANRGSALLMTKYGERPVAAYRVKFIGHHQLVGIGFGHLGSFASDYVVDRMISIEPVAVDQCDVRPN